MMYININIITIILIISLSIYLLYFQKFKNIQEPFNNKKSKRKCDTMFQQRINSNMNHLIKLQNKLDNLNINIDKAQEKVDKTYKKFKITEKNAGHSLKQLNNIH